LFWDGGFIGVSRMKNKIQWEPLVSAFAVMATILGVVVPLFMHIDNRTDAKIEAIRQDVRSFHERLISIEERRK
jgi:hypothetical protein